MSVALSMSILFAFKLDVLLAKLINPVKSDILTLT